MKTFEIEVVRTYTTTIQVELPDNLTASDVRTITRGETPYKEWLKIQDEAYHEIWDKLGEAELEQMDTEMQTCKVYELYHEEFKSFNDAPYGQEDE